MKTAVIICFFATAVCLSGPIANGQATQTRQGTIVNVQKTKVKTPPVRPGSDPVYAPLQTKSYQFDVSVRVNCEVYDVRYEHEFDDLPSALAANNVVPVRVTKRLVYLDFPGNSLKTRIVRHKTDDQGSCNQAAMVK